MGFLTIGPAGAVIGSAGCVVASVLTMRRRIANRAERLDEAMPAFIESIAAAMRAGAGLPVAIGDAYASPPLDQAVAELVRHLQVGGAFSEAVELFATAGGTPQARLVANALRIGHRSGGDLPRMLDVLAHVGRDRMRLQREARAVSAQARMSAWVVASLPVAFLFLTGATSREQTRVLFGTPVGWALLGTGALLEAAGLWWMRRLAS